MSKKGTTTTFKLDPSNLPTLTPEQAKRLDAMTGSDIDLGDVPELPASFWKQPENKAQITLRIDSDVLEYFRSQGKRYQTRINTVLRAFVDAHPRRRA